MYVAWNSVALGYRWGGDQISGAVLTDILEPKGARGIATFNL